MSCSSLNHHFGYNFRVALLDDVYKQIRANNVTASLMDESHQEASHPPFRRIDATSVNGEEGEHEVGVASGYAIQHPIPSGFVPPQNHANEIDFDSSQRYSVAGNKAGLRFFRVSNKQYEIIHSAKYLRFIEHQMISPNLYFHTNPEHICTNHREWISLMFMI